MLFVIQFKGGNRSELRRLDAEQFVGVVQGAHDVDVLACVFGEHLKHSRGAVNHIIGGDEDASGQVGALAFGKRVDGASGDIETSHAGDIHDAPAVGTSGGDG